MTYESFGRVPACCGIWKKLKPINTDKWLRTLLHGYLDEHTKNRAAGWGDTAAIPPQIDHKQAVTAGLTGLRPGVDYTPFASGIWTFGHVASRLSEFGHSPAFAQPQGVVKDLSAWWQQDRGDSAIKAHHVVASFTPRIAEELNRRGYPVDAMLLASFHQSMSQYAARYYPESSLGWVAGCHHDREHPHVHALIHPTTADGKLLRFSGLKEGEPGEDKFEFLRTAFNTRARQLFVGLTNQPGLSEDRSKMAAKQLIALCRHAMKEVGPGSLDATHAAVIKLHGWLGSREFDKVLAEASRGAEEDYRMSPPGAPDADVIRARWDEIRDGFMKTGKAHKGHALAAFDAVYGTRSEPTAYSPIRIPGQEPSVPHMSQYFELANKSSSAPVNSLMEARDTRFALSNRIRGRVNAALKAYRASLDSCFASLDSVQVQTAFGASHLAVNACASLGVPLSFGGVIAPVSKQAPRLLPSPARAEAFAEREMANVASIEAKAHQPEDPNAVPSLLASDHYPRFRELATPNHTLAEQTPTIN